MVFIPAERVKMEARERDVIKKLVDEVFTRERKRRQLEDRGFTGEELEKRLRKFVPEAILPPDDVELISKDGKSYVIESQFIALSYTSGKGPEDPHWHPDEVETYLTYDGTKVAVRHIDRPGKHEVLNLPPGRLIFPPRLCHFIDLRGHTEVMSFRQHPTMERVSCTNCHLSKSGDCTGLIESGGAFKGEHDLVSLAEGRRKWLAGPEKGTVAQLSQ
jgi:hypothetical protein